MSPDDPRMLRNVMLGDTGYRLITWETGKRASTHQHLVGYALYEPGAAEPLFTGADIGYSPMHAIDSDDCLRGIMGFLTTRPGDTDPEFLDDHTEEQLAWLDAHGEEMQEWGFEASAFEEGMLDAPAFIDVETSS